MSVTYNGALVTGAEGAFHADGSGEFQIEVAIPNGSFTTRRKYYIDLDLWVAIHDAFGAGENVDITTDPINDWSKAPKDATHAMHHVIGDPESGLMFLKNDSVYLYIWQVGERKWLNATKKYQMTIENTRDYWLDKPDGLSHIKRCKCCGQEID